LYVSQQLFERAQCAPAGWREELLIYIMASPESILASKK